MAENKMQLEDWLDDLCVRFIINLPQEDLSTVARICFHVEEAQWYYEDFIRPLDPTLPSMSLRSFCLRIFQHCPLLATFSVENHMRAFEEFLQYKTRVPVRGAILLNHEMDSTVLVKGWKKGANWSFPRGKINKDEDDLDCAVREVYEETGFDIKAAGLVPKEEDVKYIQISMREQQIRLYVFRDIPMDTPFQPMTRKEISKIQWYKLSELPAFRKKGDQQHDDAAAAMSANRFYMVAPFLVPLKKWVVQQKKKDTRLANHLYRGNFIPEEPVTEDDIGAHTEPVPEPRGNQAIDTEEGATLELRRLLNITPRETPLSGNASQDKGASLMALLQQGKGFPQQQQQQQQQSAQQAAPSAHQLPHTPLESIYTNAPLPTSPHYHHTTQRLPSHYAQPPPHMSFSHQLSPHLPQVHLSQMGQQQPRPNLPVAFYNQTHPHLQPGAQNRGFTGAPQGVYAYLGTQQQRHPEILHPQPLPPQVQQSVLTRDILPTPNMEVMANQGALGRGHHNMSGNQNLIARPQQQQQPTMEPPQLTGHKMSLLNTFKSDASRPVAQQAPAAPVIGTTAQDLSSQAAIIRNLQGPAVNMNEPPMPTIHLAKPTSILNQQMAPQQLPGGDIKDTAATPPKPSDKHRSALLDLIKKPGLLSPSSSDATVRPTQLPTSAPATKMESSQAKPLSSADAIAAASSAYGGQMRMNPETTLPFRAFEILSRPNPNENRPDHDTSMPQPKSATFATTSRKEKSPSLNLAHEGKSPPKVKHAAPRVEADIKKPAFAPQQPPLSGLPYGTNAQQLLQGPPTGQALAARRSDANPDQKQKLLSLFGKPQTSPVAQTAENKEPAKFDQMQGGPGRSRVTSVTGNGEVGSSSMSRQSSQTPMSPADRNFLLGYLQQQVSNSNP